MFNSNFYPTPPAVIEMMIKDEIIKGKTILEPSGGKGDIVDALIQEGAKNVIACEKDDDLRTILDTKCKVIEHDFLNVTSDQISHIELIVMNPPFDNADMHIIHAYEIAPAGCRIIALCNIQTITNAYTKNRQTLSSIIQSNGSYENIGQCFEDAERTTGVEVALIRVQKAGEQTSNEWDGFFTDEEPTEAGENGMMSYNVVRDLVNRYIESVKIFDEQLTAGVKMNSMTSGFFSSSMGFTCTNDGKQVKREEFKKDLQKSGWNFIFNKLNMAKYATTGLKQDINKFVETQTQIPFTMKNIYHMLDIIIGTTGSRMDKAILEVFDKLTLHYSDNRHNVEGWKTNSHYLMGKKFILPRMCKADKWNKGPQINPNYGSYFDLMEDALKAMCYMTGDNYDNFNSLYTSIRHEHEVHSNGKVKLFSSDTHYGGAYAAVEELRKKGIQAEYKLNKKEYGKEFEWAYFTVKAFKKGTMHFEFKDEKLWEQFNQRVAKLKGYLLFEATKKNNTYKAAANTKTPTATKQPVVLHSFKLEL